MIFLSEFKMLKNLLSTKVKKIQENLFNHYVCGYVQEWE